MQIILIISSPEPVTSTRSIYQQIGFMIAPLDHSLCSAHLVGSGWVLADAKRTHRNIQLTRHRLRPQPTTG